jgi:hypothetical protein
MSKYAQRYCVYIHCRAPPILWSGQYAKCSKSASRINHLRHFSGIRRATIRRAKGWLTLISRLDHRKLYSLWEAVLELHAPTPYADLPRRLFEILSRCLSFDFLAYRELVDEQNERSFIYPEHNFDIRVFDAPLDKHSTWNTVVRDRLKSPIDNSDFTRLAERPRTDSHGCVSKYLQQSHKLALITPDYCPHIEIALNRSTSDFSEEDRLSAPLAAKTREPKLLPRAGKPSACQGLAQTQSRLLAQKEVFNPSTVTRSLPSTNSSR